MITLLKQLKIKKSTTKKAKNGNNDIKLVNNYNKTVSRVEYKTMESIEEALQNSVTAAEKQIEDFKIKFIKNYEIVFIKYFLKHLEEIFFCL
ncbi:hypothetical protein GVAV_000830 [Gurleya vavrai]